MSEFISKLTEEATTIINNARHAADDSLRKNINEGIEA